MKTQTKDLSLAWQISLIVMLSTVIVMMPDLSFATPSNTPMGNVLCTVLAWFTGNVGKGLGSIAICILGIGALLGKISWGMSMIVGIGIAIIFGAAGIVNTMGAGVAGVTGNGGVAATTTC